MSTLKSDKETEERAPLEGVRFVTDAEGNRVAVMLDLAQWGEIWEDIYDNMIASRRADEPSTTLDEFEEELRAEGLLNDRPADHG